MSGHRRARAKRSRTFPASIERRLELWNRALPVRDSWLSHALSTEPADRTAAQAAINELYDRLGVAPPEYEWVSSPAAAPTDIALTSLPRQFVYTMFAESGELPFAARLATLQYRMKTTLDRGIGATAHSTWSSPLEVSIDDVASGQRSLPELLDRGIRDQLQETVRDAIRIPLRDTLTASSAAGLHFAWYGQHDAHWIAHYDAYRHLGLDRFDPDAARQLDLWAAIARSCGWWWPTAQRCVIAERPSQLHSEDASPTLDGRRRLHNAQGAAVRYADGWGVYSWHGTRVPGWVITDPTPERIAAESNVEVRRCAIEHLGWDAYIQAADLRLVNASADPGNSDCVLELYELPPARQSQRVLLATNGSVERDGVRRRYGLTVPADINDPIAAAGWSYGLTGPQYAQLARRT